MNFTRFPNSQVNFFSLITQHFDIGCWVLNLSDGKNWWSEKFFELLGLPASSDAPTLEYFITNLVHPEDKKKVKSAVNSYNSKNFKAHNQQVRLLHSSGRYRWFEIFGELKVFGNDDDRYVFGSIKNIESRKLYQEESEKLKFMIDVAEEMAGVGVFDINFITGQRYWSKKVYEIFEIPETHALKEKKVIECFEMKSRQRLRQSIYNLKKHKISFDEELLMISGKGNKVWVHCMAKPVINEDGDVIAVRGLFQDINEKINKDLLLHKYLDKLEAHQYFLNEKSSISKMGGWEVNFNEHHVFWDEQTKRIHEVTEKFNPTPKNVLQFFNKDAQQVLNTAFNNLKTAGTPFDLELQFTTAKHKTLWARIMGTAVRDAANNITGARGIFQDVNEQKIRSLKLENSLHMITRQNEKLTNFAHIVSHNLRTHTSNLKLLSQIIEQEQDTKEKLSWLGNVRSVSEALDETVTGLTDIVRSYSSDASPRSRVNFSATINNICKAIRLNKKEESIDLSTDFAACPSVEYVPAYLESILMNLVTNAIKYKHPERRAAIKIRTYFKEDGRPCLEITDNGRGIDLQTYGNKLFGLNQTFHGNRDARGIGLYITRNQIENLGGTIEAESQINIGTTFKVTF